MRTVHVMSTLERVTAAALGLAPLAVMLLSLLRCPLPDPAEEDPSP